MLKKGINGAIKAVVKDCMKMERQWDRAVRQQVAPSSSTINGSGLHRAVAKLCTAGRGLGMAQESGAGPTPDLLTAVKSACLDLRKTLGRWQDRWADAGSWNRVAGALLDTVRSIKRAEAIMVDWVPVRGERDSRYGEGWVLKQALEVIAPAVARQSSLAIVEAWIENCAPVTDFQNPRDVIRLARIYAMALVPDQLWELRFISEHPERSMVLVTILDGMPPRGTLERFVEPADWDERVYVIAARKPNWRALWRGQLWDW